MKRFLPLLFLSLWTCLLAAAEPIDRYAVVTRHNIQSQNPNLLMQIGNGNICFNSDGTGFQNLGGSLYAHWGWFSEKLPEGYTPEDIPATGTTAKGRLTGPDDFIPETDTLAQWLFDNPRRMNLVRIRLVRSDGTEISPKEISFLTRELDLWSGLITSKFSIDGNDFVVESAAADKNQMAFRVTGTEAFDGSFALQFDFPYPTVQFDQPWGGDFSLSELHQTEMKKVDDGQVLLTHRFGDQAYDCRDYHLRLFTSETLQRKGENKFLLPLSGSLFQFALSVAPESNSVNCLGDDTLYENEALSFDSFDIVLAQSEKRWQDFWTSGGFIDLSSSQDPRWFELERRIILSQFQLRISDSGEFPAAEAGLLQNDCWRGQFHMEMVWWHQAHWFLWERENYSYRALKCYDRFKSGAKLLAEQLDYRGYKWQKSVGPEGRTAPWMGNLMLLWKQPHPIFFAELDYRAHPTSQTLERWSDLIEGTAEHMADYVTRDEQGICHLDPAMPPSEVGYSSDTTFDLAYWQLGLLWANRWRERMGLPRNNEWDDVRLNLAPFPVKDDIYPRAAVGVDARFNHPDHIGAFGQFSLNGGENGVSGFDLDRARRTVEWTYENWDLDGTWGWDFPWLAMAAARMGRTDLAIEFLLYDGKRNHYDERGVNTGGPCPYLPGNGGLLYVVAMMCAGWDNGPAIDKGEGIPNGTYHKSAPGFPEGWSPRWENLRPAP